MRNALVPLAVLVAAALVHCAPVASAVGGSCHGTQMIGPSNVTICSEGPTATVDQQVTLNSACRSGQLGTAANDWHQSEACPTGRVGGCQRSVNGIDVVTWVYPSDPNIDENAVRQFCASISATFVAP